MANDAVTSQPAKLDMTNAIPLSMKPEVDVEGLAAKYHLDPDVINNQIQQESSGNQSAVSKKGAIGLMQLMPETAARLGVDPHDPEQNVTGGMQEMQRLLGKYNGDYSKALAAYNAGETKVDHAGGIPNISETQDYVNSILKGTKYDKSQVKDQPPAKLDMSKAIPLDNEQPSVPERFNQGLTSTFGLPSDITKWPSAVKDMLHQMGQGPLSGQSGQPSISNIPLNIAKNTIKSSGAASQEGIDEFKQPGAINKVGGALKYVIGGLPIAGPMIVKAMDEAENGNYAGMTGSLTGIGLQALMANPEAAASRLDAAGKYLFSKPRVQETILAGETQDMLRATEAAARAKGHDMFPQTSDIPPVPGHYVDEIAQKALNDHIAGITGTPKPIADILGENPAKFKRLGAIEGPGGGLIDIFSRMSSDQPVSMEDLHNYYTKLGEFSSKDLPGDVYAAVKQTRDSIGKLIGEQYQGAPPEPATKTITNADGIQVAIANPNAGADRLSMWQDAKSYWHDLATHWWDSDSPLKAALDEKDPSAILSHLTGDTSERAKSYLSNYTNEGGDPKAIDAINTLKKGMTQMQLRGLLQASGGLLLSYIARSAGMPGKEAIWGATGFIGSRLGLGYLRTRPSLTNLLSEAAEKPSSISVPPTAAIPAMTGANVDHSQSNLSSTDLDFLRSIHAQSSVPSNLREDISEALSEYGH